MPDYGKTAMAGMLLATGAALFLTGMSIASFLYPGYSVSGNYISDLGVGSTAIIFNSSLLVFGMMVLMAAFMFFRRSKFRAFSISLFAAGIGMTGVAVFNEGFGHIHLAFALTAFLFGALSAVLSFKMLRKPLNYLAAFLGLFSLLFLSLFIASYSGGAAPFLGIGGEERMIVYAVLMWALIFGGALSGSQNSSR